jgi:hypothetical protein
MTVSHITTTGFEPSAFNHVIIVDNLLSSDIIVIDGGYNLAMMDML